MENRLGWGMVAAVFAVGLAVGMLAAMPEVRAEDQPDCSRSAGSLPFPGVSAGAEDPSNPVRHIVVMMQENHSFDNFFGKLASDGYEGEVDGIDETRFNLDAKGRRVHPFHLEKYCVRDPNHNWGPSHAGYDGGRMDQVLLQNDDPKKHDGFRVMGYYDRSDMPYYYELANQFAIADRYFASTMTSTYPNRFYSVAATSFGHIKNNFPVPFTQFKQTTIFDTLNKYDVTWKYYYTDLALLLLFQPLYWHNLKHIAPIAEFKHDLEHGKLPQVAFVENSVILGDEHPPFNFQLAQHSVSEHINDLMHSPFWRDSALFLTYDEGGGYYDHVAPPPACAPDDIPPMVQASDGGAADGFARYGGRVPFVLVSPFAKRHYVSHVTHDHTSILKFIETKFNLPALTRRDANADAMLDMFDFAHPRYDYPEIPAQKVDFKKLIGCFNPKQGYGTPPIDDGASDLP